MPDFDTSIPHIARVYDYWLGGKDNFAADRELGERTLQAYPNLVFSVRANRAFLTRTVRFLAAEAGIRQFLDIGTGIPTNNNTHQVAQRIAPVSRIVYVDNDPIVLSHAKALLTSKPEGACAYLDADLRDPDKILASAATPWISASQWRSCCSRSCSSPPDGEAMRIVKRLMDACVPGSFVTISHPATDIDAEPHGRDGPAHERVPGREGHAARPGRRGRPVRRARAGRTRPGPGPGVAAGQRPRGGQSGGALGRRRPQALMRVTASRTRG